VQHLSEPVDMASAELIGDRAIVWDSNHGMVLYAQGAHPRFHNLYGDDTFPDLKPPDATSTRMAVLARLKAKRD